MSVLKLLILFSIAICVLCGPCFAQEDTIASNYSDRKAVIVNNCPSVELSGFSFENRFRDSGNHFDQEMKWKNVGKQAIVAFEIVILKYDAFNERLIGTKWTVTGTDSAQWKPLDVGESGADGLRGLDEEEVYTAIAYVRIARFKDGTIWRASDTKLLPLLHKAAPEIEEFGDIKPDPKPKAK